MRFPADTYRRLLSLSVVVALIASGKATDALAQSIVLDTPITALSEDAFAVGKTLAKSNTLENKTLDELITRVAGSPSVKAFQKYGGDFNAYWEVSKTQRAGKVFEAISAFTENRRLARLGDPTRLLVTAAEGNPAHAADMLRVDASLRIMGHDQYKLGWQAARNAITDTRYVGKAIVIPPDEMEILARELTKAEANAARRGLPLASKWQGVKEAVGEGRIAARLPSGEMAPTRNEVLRIARRQLQAEWIRLARTAEPTGIPEVLTSRPVLGTLRVVGKVAGTIVVVVDVAGTGYQTYSDVARYRAGEIGGVYLGAKSSMRAAQLALAYYTVFAPDPTLLTKIAAGIGCVVLIAADNISDCMYEARRDQARRLLETIDRDERFLAANKQLLESGSH